MKKAAIIILGVFLLTLSSSVFANYETALVITEFKNSETDQWIEILNNSNQELNPEKIAIKTNNEKFGIFNPNPKSISPNELIVITNEPETFTANYPEHIDQIFSSTVFQTIQNNQELQVAYDEASYDQILYSETPGSLTKQKTSDNHEIESEESPFQIIEQNNYPEPITATLLGLISEIKNSNEVTINFNQELSEGLNDDWYLVTENQSINLNEQENRSKYGITVKTDGESSEYRLIKGSETIDYICLKTTDVQNFNSTEWHGECLDNKPDIKRTFSIDTNTANDWTQTVEQKNYPPKAVINHTLTSTNKTEISLNLDGSKSLDPESEPLKFEWFLDQKLISTESKLSNYKITDSQNHTITLKVTDQKNQIDQDSIELLQTETIKVIPCTTITEPSKIITEDKPEVINEKPTSSIQLSTEIKIHSYLANPTGTDTNNEWIKIINNSTEPVNLESWQLDDVEGGSKPFTITNLTIQPKQILTFSNKDTKIALNNNGDTIRIIDPNQKIIDSLTYEKAEEDQIGPLESNLQSNKQPSLNTTQEILTIQEPNSSKFNNQVIISELLPNPKGDDKSEWLELKNLSSKKINLKDWTILSNKKEITLNENLIIPPYTYLVISSTNSKISLSNSKSEIKLLDPQKNKIHSINYDKAPEGKSYSLFTDNRNNKLTASTNRTVPIKNTWQWTKHLTPNANNPEIRTIEGAIKSTSNLNELIIESDNNPMTINYETKQIAPAQLAIIKNNPQIILEVIQTTHSLFLQKIIELSTINKTHHKRYYLIALLLVLIGTPLAISKSRNWLYAKTKLALRIVSN